MKKTKITREIILAERVYISSREKFMQFSLRGESVFRYRRSIGSGILRMEIKFHSVGFTRVVSVLVKHELELVFIPEPVHFNL